MQQPTIPLLVVTGPTASGKTRLAVDLALAFGGEVVSADSMQIYREMDIGTAKPTVEEQQGIPHHLVDFLPYDATFSVAEYLVLARQCIEEITARGRLPILCGGTGLYISSLVDHIDFAEIESDPQLRRDLQEQAQREGNEAMWEQLRSCDPELAERLHPNNLGRIIRALEVYRLTGKPMSQHQAESRHSPSPYKLCMIGLDFRERATLYDRIDRRVDVMLEQGLVEEVRRMLARGISPTAFQAIGYKEFCGYLGGEQTLQEAADHLKMQTRRYAKRQLSWLRRDERIHWLYGDDYTGYEPLLAEALALVKRSFAHLPD